jgi:hypothetical protein
MTNCQNSEARQRVLLLGASNVTRSCGTLLAAIRTIWKGPVEVLAAHGHGRSYGASTSVFIRRLPGILPSGLWPALRALPPAPTAALVTDIGNDILYEHPVSTIADWVEQCLDQLAAADASTVVTSMPVANLPGLSEKRFRFFRNLFMPGCQLSLREVVDRVQSLNEQVRTMVLSRSMKFVVPERAWYGLDPIHVRMRDYPRAWNTILSAWDKERKNTVISRGKLRDMWRVRISRPERVMWLGRELGAAQPSVHWRDGTTLSLY